MHIHIDTADNAERERVIGLLQYLLSGQQAEIDSLLLSIEPVGDALGTRLNHCQLRSTLKNGQQIEVEEIQSSFDLAVTRALERCMLHANDPAKNWNCLTMLYPLNASASHAAGADFV